MFVNRIVSDRDAPDSFAVSSTGIIWAAQGSAALAETSKSAMMGIILRSGQTW
jgi:hypothetical protein